jgi:hypothetical protein
MLDADVAVAVDDVVEVVAVVVVLVNVLVGEVAAAGGRSPTPPAGWTL